MPAIRVDDVEIYYEWHGADSAPVLVLNNGILMNAASSWVNQTAVLARSLRVLQYDCRGQGASSHPATPYSMALHARDLAGLLSALGVERAHIAGISYGGEVAQAFALACPDRVSSLFLADTVSEIGPELRRVAASWRDRAAAGDADGLFDVTVPWNFSEPFIAANPALMAASRARFQQLDLPAVVRLCDAFLALDLTPRLGAIAAPTCVAVGDLDRLKGVAYAEVIHRAIRGSELHVMRGAGHASCWERPHEFNTVLLGFVSKHI